MVPFSILMDLLMHFTVSFAIALFLMPFMMVRAVDSLLASSVRTAVMAAAVMPVGHDRGVKAP